MTEAFSVLLFAAGLGTRMKYLTASRPKPLVKVAGQTLLDHALAFTKIPQINKRVVNVHYKADMIKAHLLGTDIQYSDETDLLRETGGGLKHAMPLLGANPVLTLNTDAVWSGPNPIVQLLSAWGPRMDALLMLIPQNQARGHKGKGDFHLSNDGKLTRGPGPIYSGLQIIRTELLDKVDETCFSMNIIWDEMIVRQSLFGITYDGLWCDVGQPESVSIAEAMLAEIEHV